VNFIYFAKSGRYVKIGISKNPQNRMKELQIGNPNKIELLHFFKGETFSEKFLHKRFRKYHCRGEWFKFSKEIELYLENVK
jgi:hypothetical protein